MILAELKAKNVGDHKAAVRFLAQGACKTTFRVLGGTRSYWPLVGESDMGDMMMDVFLENVSGSQFEDLDFDTGLRTEVFL